MALTIPHIREVPPTEYEHIYASERGQSDEFVAGHNFDPLNVSVNAVDSY